MCKILYHGISGSDDLDGSGDEDSRTDDTDPDVTVGELENPVPEDIPAQ